MAEISSKMLIDLLKRFSDEVTKETIQHYLFLEDSVAERFCNKKDGYWPREKTWKENAKAKFEELTKKYQKANEKEKGKIIDELNEEYECNGINSLIECCYYPDDENSFILEERLANLTIAVFQGRRQNADIRSEVLEFLDGRKVPAEDVEVIRDMEEDDYEKIAKFLVRRVKENSKRLRGGRGQDSPVLKTPVRAPHVILRSYEELVALGLSAREIAHNLVENDYKVYPDIRPENEADAAQWEQYLSRYHDAFAYLVDEQNHIVGNWSFLSLTEEQRQQMLKGELLENTLTIDSTSSLYVGGEHTLYLLNLSCNDGFNKPQYYQMLLDKLWERMLYIYADAGIFFKSFYINVFHPVYEALWKSMGFRFIVNNCASGRIYGLELYPFPTTLKATDPAILQELKRRYDEYFSDRTAT
ncbi:MAG: hypothetical protein K2H40_11635 [Lachnospiraceae bacterium]|nr:hypothetical protein [Lachnospiraceae bacterium]